MIAVKASQVPNIFSGDCTLWPPGIYCLNSTMFIYRSDEGWYKKAIWIQLEPVQFFDNPHFNLNRGTEPWTKIEALTLEFK